MGGAAKGATSSRDAPGLACARRSSTAGVFPHVIQPPAGPEREIYLSFFRAICQPGNPSFPRRLASGPRSPASSGPRATATRGSRRTLHQTFRLRLAVCLPDSRRPLSGAAVGYTSHKAAPRPTITFWNDAMTRTYHFSSYRDQQGSRGPVPSGQAQQRSESGRPQDTTRRRAGRYLPSAPDCRRRRSADTVQRAISSVY